MNNKKGFTLVEISTTLAIAALVTIITAGIIISALNYFGDSTTDDSDKQTVDNVMSYINSQVKYSTNIYFGDTKPTNENWKCLYIKDNKLYDENGSVLKDENYPKDRDIKVSVKGYSGKYLLDVNVELLDGSKTLYNTKKTFALMNLSLKNLDDSMLSSVTATKELSSSFRLYYTYDDQVDQNEYQKSNKGTVSDQIKFLNNYNNRGDWVINNVYHLGDIVYYNGYYWIDTTTADIANSLIPGTDIFHWKRIDSELLDYNLSENNKLQSAYSKGDIIRYNDKYYRFKGNDNVSYVMPDVSYQTTWEEVSETVVRQTTYTSKSTANLKTVMNKLDGIELSDISEYDSNKTYSAITIPTSAEDFVKIKDSNDNYVYYYKALAGTGAPGSSPTSGWQKLSVDYDSKSTYLKDDVVAGYIVNNSYKTLKAYRNVNFIVDFNNHIYTNPSNSSYTWIIN